MATVTYSIRTSRGHEIGQIEARYDSGFHGVFNIDGTPHSGILSGFDLFGAVPRRVSAMFAMCDTISEANRSIIGTGLSLSPFFAR